MENLNQQSWIDTGNLFDRHFVDARKLYMYCFGSLPSVSVITQIDGEKAFAEFLTKCERLITGVHRYRWYEQKKKNFRFSRTVIVLSNQCVAEFDAGSCELLYGDGQQQFIDEISGFVTKFRERKKRERRELNLVIESNGYFELKPMEVKRTKLDLGLYFEDDFRAVDEVIRNKLGKKGEKGIVLLHGLPGTGKTSYLRWLIARLKKRVMFLSPAVARNLMNPEFIELLIDNPNTVLVIEDAENIIADRKLREFSAVSNLLNISDGLLADCLNVQMICTFNSSLTLVDPALMRKGRLIARYEFGKLNTGKAQTLSDHLGFDTVISRPMTLSEIVHQHEHEYTSNRVEVIGFRTVVREN